MLNPHGGAYILLSTDCFIVSQLFSVARHAGCFKLGSKPTQLYVRLSILPLTLQTAYISSGIIMHYVLASIYLHFTLPNTRVLNSLEEICITQVAVVNSFARVLNPREGSIYIIIHKQTVLVSHNSSVWLDMQDASSWDWNPPKFTLDLVSYRSDIYSVFRQPSSWSGEALPFPGT